MNKVKFNLNKPNKDKSLIMLVYRYESGKLLMSTGITIPTSDWNKSAQRLRTTQGKFEYPRYNQWLNNYERAVSDVLLSYTRIRETPTILQLKDGIEKAVSSSAAAASLPKGVLKFINSFIETRESEGILTKGTIHGYKQLETIIKEFPKGRTLQFNDLSEKRLNALTAFMVQNRNYGTNQINKIQRRLNTVVKSAILEGFEVPASFEKGNWRVKVSKINDSGIALSSEELEKIKSASLSPKLDKVRDRLLIGFATGQRYSDFKDLSIDDIVEEGGKKYFNIAQKKTRKVVKLPITEAIQNILDKYGGYPKTYSEQKFNEYIKDVCEAAELNDIIIIRKENPLKGVVSEERKKKYEIISSHDCRRTFATLLHNRGIPPAAIMKLTGHSNLKTFSSYLKIDMTEVSKRHNLSIL